MSQTNRTAVADLLWYDRRRLAPHDEHRLHFCELENRQRGGPPREGFAHIAAIVVANTPVTGSAQLHIDGLDDALSTPKNRLVRSGRGCLVVPAGAAKLLMNRGAGWSTANKRNAVVTVKNRTSQAIEYCIAILGTADSVPVPCGNTDEDTRIRTSGRRSSVTGALVKGAPVTTACHSGNMSSSVRTTRS